MDRNLTGCHFVDLGQKSLSARRAWIEIKAHALSVTGSEVALRKESVDRNYKPVLLQRLEVCRSPQGERG